MKPKEVNVLLRVPQPTHLIKDLTPKSGFTFILPVSPPALHPTPGTEISSWDLLVAVSPVEGGTHSSS